MLVFLGLTASIAPAGSFPGWQGMRVIEQRGNPVVMRSADLTGKGPHQLIVVNGRYSRLDLYRYVGQEDRKPPVEPDPKRPNDLPMAPQFEHDEIQLELLPVDLLVRDLDGDGQAELVILVSPPNKVLIYEHNDDQWQQRDSYDLQPATISPRHRAMILRSAGEEGHELLVSCDDGIQRLCLAPAGRAEWLKPHEQRDREAWWLADLDGDGDQDLIEQSRQSDESIRWYECGDDSRLMPAQVLFDRAIKNATVIGGSASAAQLLLLDGASNGLLRRYKLHRGDHGQLGRRRALALEGGTKAVWCGLQLADEPVLVFAEKDRPRLLTYALADNGWQPRPPYPVVADVRALVAPQAQSGTLLLWAKDSGDLHVSRWDNGRLSYPKPMVQSDVEDRKILALASAGSTAWWVQKVGQDLDLYTWRPGAAEPDLVRFGDKVGKKADKVAWLGGQRLLVKDKASSAVKLIVVEDGQTDVRKPAHLKKADISEFMLVPVGDDLRAARLTDGVLQWLDDDLNALDQIMLPESRRLAGYVALDERRGWALQHDGQYVHLLETDDAGLSKVTQSEKLAGGASLVADPVLGLILVEHTRVTHLAAGKPSKLELIESIDNRVGRPSGVKEATIHRILAADISGDGHSEVILLDDRRHQLTVLGLIDDKLQPRISWPVFEDKKYPYGGDNAPLIKQPRAVVALDLDGDGRQDLAMLCHDRLILYLAADEP